MPEKRARKEQEDIVAKKGGVTKSDRGLQQWGDPMGEEDPDHSEGIHGGATGQYGDASMGTAERAAKIGGLAPGYEPGEGKSKKREHPDTDE